jgi:hypothetical protein
VTALTLALRLADADRALLARAGRLAVPFPTGASAPAPSASAVTPSAPWSPDRVARDGGVTGAARVAQAALRGTSCGFLPDRLAAAPGSPPSLPRERRGLLRDTPSPTGGTPVARSRPGRLVSLRPAWLAPPVARRLPPGSRRHDHD